MSTFHLSPRLPLEIRQQIWELSVGPREVAVGEARSHLQTRYRKVFGFPHDRPVREGGYRSFPPIYTWVNIDIDTVYCHQSTFERVLYEIQSLRWLVIETCDPEYWFFESGFALIDVDTAIESVTILHPPGRTSRFDSRWWAEWDD
ncbi:hypothetical protein F4802DRAFT_597280 [Xylaria palmicola]|nr:hypothetical protein F4802DRAFT_597280 [Xylaria palmicola]